MTVGLFTACGGETDKAPAGPPGGDAEAGSAKEAPEPPAPEPIAGKPVDGAGPANPAVKEGAPASDERYTLQIQPPGEAKAGEEGVVHIKVLPKGPWHMNLEYPTKLTVTPPDGVTLAKAEQKKPDAVSLTDETCEFDVAFTSTAAGDKSFSGKFKFAICQDEACSPVQEDIDFKVAVK